MKGHLAETWWSDPCEWAGKITPDRILRCWGKSCVRNQGQHSWTGVRWQGGGSGRQEQETTGRSGGPGTCEWGIWFYSVRVGCHCRIWKDLIWCWAPRFSGHFRRQRTDTTYARRNQGGQGEAMSIVSMITSEWAAVAVSPSTGQADETLSGDGCWMNESSYTASMWTVLRANTGENLFCFMGKGAEMSEFHLDT